MRLLKAKTLEFEDILREDETPVYAILSHTWGKDEVTFKDMQKRRAQAEEKQGYGKITRCAEQALRDGIHYCWVDSCCINKNSSAELSEAINSMFRWYRNAIICYAFLSDVPERPEEDSWAQQDAWGGRFKDSRWFTRGWTLQELIAPRNLTFFSSNWARIGTKADMSGLLESLTGVPADVLLSGETSSSSIAQRMSWAANRSTSRVEDVAYCLMGIFDVNMAMLYGEGEKAFLRLQEEIIRTSDDRSIFAWCDPTAPFSAYRGVLAKHPSNFAQCKDVIWSRTAHKPYNITNMGIHLDLQL
ncbi:HET-domain-containing protein, partial [Trematosphaeria pertusa]